MLAHPHCVGQIFNLHRHIRTPRFLKQIPSFLMPSHFITHQGPCIEKPNPFQIPTPLVSLPESIAKILSQPNTRPHQNRCLNIIERLVLCAVIMMLLQLLHVNTGDRPHVDRHLNLLPVFRLLQNLNEDAYAAGFAERVQGVWGDECIAGEICERGDNGGAGRVDEEIRIL